MSIFFGSLIGFLIRNFKPAFYIMGDCGSYFSWILFINRVIYFSSNGLENSVPFQYMIILFSLPIFDMTFVVLNRVLKKLNPLKPDANHIHHRMIKAGISYEFIIFSIYLLFNLLLLANLSLF